MNSAINPATVSVDAAQLKASLQQHLAADLDSVNALLHRRLKSSSHFVSDVTEHVSRFQGKQIRPVLLLLTHGLLNSANRTQAITLAAVVEMIHTATLVHDDVIDDADTRRHVATVQRRWNSETSVLLGDYLFSKAFHLAASTGDAEACRLIGLATDRTCEGELNQIAARLDRSTSELDYFRIIRDKTGQLFGLSCLLGARAADASVAEQQTLRRFGMLLGLAFQIADDVLDLAESHESTGKDEGNDLHNGRLTLPLLRALQLADPSERNQLRNLLLSGHTSCSPEQLRHRASVQRGLASASATATEFCRRAIRLLDRFPACTDRDLLTAIAKFAGQRNT